jgi:hypothetical protein
MCRKNLQRAGFATIAEPQVIHKTRLSSLGIEIAADDPKRLSSGTSMKLGISALIAVTALIVGTTASAGVLTATNSTFGSFDSSSGTRTFSLGAGNILDVDISIDFAKCDGPALTSGSVCPGDEFSFNREIVFRLTSPGGTTVSLVEQDTYSGQIPGARVVVDLDDEALTGVGGSLLASGSFRPEGLLSAFDGGSASGIWTLFIADTVGADPLSFFSATLRVTVPEPGSVALLGLALGAMAVALRRRRIA